MTALPNVVKIATLLILSLIWLTVHKRVLLLESNKLYHVAIYQRSRRQEVFYSRSVWVGLSAAFLSMIFIELLSDVFFDSDMVRDWTFGLLRGLGIWGLTIIGLVWLRVALRNGKTDPDEPSLFSMREKNQKP